MASFKELSLSRPLPQTNPRHHSHSHSISLGAVNSNHRVTRRKSVTTAAAANAAAVAVAASLKDTNGEPIGMPVTSHRRGSARRGLESSSVGALSGFGHYLSRSMNSPSQEPPVARKASPTHSNSNPAAATAAATTTTTTGEDESSSDSKPLGTKSRNRRASEGSHLVKGEGKRTLAELRCERCGKGYKHGSCLSKHMWEHDPAWAITSKLLISKHQQVQLLEAATVLVNMNLIGPSDIPEADSEASSASPDASSELRDGLSSAETTPPPMDEDDDDEDDDMEMSGMPAFPSKRFSVGNASGPFSHSYQSIPSSSYNDSAPLHSPAFSHFRHSSIDTRPSTAEAKLHEDDEADLAAAIGLCNFGTPRTGPVPMSPSIPPVPPLPTRYLDQSNGAGSTSQSLNQSGDGKMASSLANSTPNLFLSVSFNPSLSYKVSDEREVRMGDADRVQRQTRNADVDFSNRPAHADDDDDGVFGRMEE
ncbi:putative C2H2 finger domain protein [Aspergillus clavatus NRRL 1]|uniref:C2H2 finger domain protein, putative n=1 Tax=Aspergillus clavatus (strain ATCC 1007 / CBS 513.65 / DSM 816 / NCTC 3887 / NRRL 1 / QM 1276 / 107) TaxID=344612 RepID=A1CF59_ASPCL|nr:C2H2 finger domain protein, putative [Aspergillus clavatus NRRL 1]EAW11508.1 C2H2 finger domain protein, putative [Aspergillus clavatus NRRL 1]